MGIYNLPVLGSVAITSVIERLVGSDGKTTSAGAVYDRVADRHFHELVVRRRQQVGTG